MHTAEMMARLNPATVRYDIGRGGMPELTSTDIAAAIAFVPEGLGRELMCRLWWPDGAQLSHMDLDRLLMDAQLDEWRRRADRLVTAQLRAEVALNDHQRRRSVVEIEAAKAEMWPRIGPGSCYGAIRAAVLAEMSAGCLCPACRGRGFIVSDSELVACRFCATTGRAKVSDRNRAELIGRDQTSYRTVFAPVYEWLLDLCTEAVEPAQRHFRRALR